MIPSSVPDVHIPMPGYGHAVPVAVDRQCHSHVAALGSRHAVAIVTGQQLGDLVSCEVSGQLHTAKASSLIRCNLITLGMFSPLK